MATRTQVNAFIDKLSVLAISECMQRDKKICPSVCIAQAALETGWGTSSLMLKANAYFGIKATGWNGKVYNAKTKESYDGKTLVNTSAYFRAYDSLSDSVKDYYDLLTNSSRYAQAVNEPDATKCIKAIKAGGYATDPLYVSKITSIIKTYGLTKYDVCMKDTKQPKYADLVAKKCGLEKQTVDYINAYTYADALWEKLYKQMV